MEAKVIQVTRWFDGVIEGKQNVNQQSPVRAMNYWGHAPNSQVRGPDMKKAMEALDLFVIIDPYPTVSAVMQDRTDGVYLLPAANQLETDGPRPPSNRSPQWGYQSLKALLQTKRD